MTVARLLEEMPASELTEWYVFDRLEAERRAADEKAAERARSKSGNVDPGDDEDEE